MKHWIVSRPAAAALLTLGMLAVAVQPAAAHGGPLVFAGDAGPYRLEAYRFFRSASGQDVMPYRLHLRSRATGAPVEGAHVTVSITREREVVGPTEAIVTDEDYEAEFLPIVEGGWTVRVDINGALGPAAVVHPLPAPASIGEFVTMYGLPLLLIVAIWLVRRRMRGLRTSVQTAPTSSAENRS